VLGQIVAVQLGFWLVLGAAAALLDMVVGETPLQAPLQMFDWRVFRLDSVRGYVSVIAFVAAASLACVVMLLVVGRAKKCLDFCSTMYGYHALTVVAVSRSLPRSFLWWVLLVVGVVLSTVCSELVCLRRELREIPVSSGSSMIV
jgi:hypothetical protein